MERDEPTPAPAPTESGDGEEVEILPEEDMALAWEPEEESFEVKDLAVFEEDLPSFSPDQPDPPEAAD